MKHSSSWKCMHTLAQSAALYAPTYLSCFVSFPDEFVKAVINLPSYFKVLKTGFGFFVSLKCLRGI